MKGAAHRALTGFSRSRQNWSAQGLVLRAGEVPAAGLPGRAHCPNGLQYKGVKIEAAGKGFLPLRCLFCAPIFFRPERGVPQWPAPQGYFL